MVIDIDTRGAVGNALVQVSSGCSTQRNRGELAIPRALFRHLGPLECDGKTPGQSRIIVLIFARFGIRIAASKNLAINHAKRQS